LNGRDLRINILQLFFFRNRSATKSKCGLQFPSFMKLNLSDESNLARLYNFRNYSIMSRTIFYSYILGAGKVAFKFDDLEVLDIKGE